MAWTTPKTWAGSELLTASDLNQYVSDNLSLLYELVSSGGRKNLLHNGAMQVAQRSTSVALITTSAISTADRWWLNLSSLGTWTNSVENDAPAGSGFRKSFKALCTTADASPAASDYASVAHRIEGQNLQSVLKGTASAKKLTLSFWTKSNKTGTYVVELYDADNSRHCSKSYTVTASATWEQQSVTFPADLTGAFDNDANASLNVNFFLAAGSNYTGGTLATTWAAYSATNEAVGQTNVAASNSNYWMVTGVQLETGDTATGYQHKNYDQELSECMRYYQKFWANSAVSGSSAFVGVGQITSTSAAYILVPLVVPMCTYPAFSYAGTIGVSSYSVASVAMTSASTHAAPTPSAFVTVNAANTVANWATTTTPAMFVIPASTGGTYIAFSADI